MATVPLSMRWPVLLLRVLASLLGGYAFVFGFVTLAIAVAVALGMPYSEADRLAAMLAFLLYLVCFFAAFVVRSLVRVWAVLGGGGAAMLAAGAWLARALQ